LEQQPTLLVVVEAAEVAAEIIIRAALVEQEQTATSTSPALEGAMVVTALVVDPEACLQHKARLLRKTLIVTELLRLLTVLEDRAAVELQVALQLVA
jgi:hypothetical protein